MKIIYKLLKWTFIGISLFGVAVLLLGFGFMWFWNSQSVNSLSEAKELLKKHRDFEYRIMINECSKLFALDENITLSRDEIPINLKSISPEYIRVSGYSCEINLFKVPGKGIGYFVSKTQDGSFKISWHDYFESWDSHEINIVQ